MQTCVANCSGMQFILSLTKSFDSAGHFPKLGDTVVVRVVVGVEVESSISRNKKGQ